MISFLLGIFLIFSTSSSFAEGEVDFLEMPNEIEQVEETAKEQTSFAEELKKLGHSRIDLNTLRDPRFSEVVEKAYNESNISLLSLKKKKELFREQLEGSKLNELLAKFPVVENILADVLTDRDSMMGLLRMIQKEKELTTFFYAIIILFILNFILKKLVVNFKANIVVRFFQRTMVNLLTTALVIGVLFHLFEKELSPMIRVIKAHL